LATKILNLHLKEYKKAEKEKIYRSFYFKVKYW
jgi:hypothetical protein